MAERRKGPDGGLRSRARGRLEATRTEVAALTTDEVQQLVEELQIHQVELEIQNEELREAQQELAALRDRYQELFEFAPVGYVTLDEQAFIREANLTATTMLGAGRAELVGRNLRGFVAPQGEDEFHRTWQRHAVAPAAAAIHCELPLRESDGVHRIVQLQCERRDDAHGGGCLLFCALIDLTERKRAENALAELNEDLERRVEERSAELRRRQEELRTIVDTAPEGVLTVNADGLILTANPAAAEMFAAPGARLEGGSVGSLLPGVDHWDARAAPDSGAARQIDRLDVLACRCDGSTFPARLSVARVPEQDFFVAIVVDVSEARELEREVLNVAEDERRRISRELHDSVGQSLAGLAMIVRSREKRLGGYGDEVSAAFAETRAGLEEAVRDTRAVIHDLAPAGLDEGGLAHALEHVAEGVRAHSAIDCTCECTGPEPAIDIGSKLQLLRIATEAAHNALKHAEADQIAIRLDTGPREVSLSVTDNGRGIVAVTEGMGIGIMRHRAQVIGGHLEVGQHRPCGTIVRATVPL